MDVNERFEASAATMDELKAKLEKAHETVKESMKDGVANFKSDVKFTTETVDEVFEDAEKQHDLNVEKRIDKVIDAEDKFDAKREERREARKAKIDELKGKINDLGQAYAKADQEELIADLLVYAEDCEATALYMAQEAVLAYEAAAKELADYYEKYGE